MARDERGQMMMLSGVLLVVAFVLTALTLAEIRHLEQETTKATEPGLSHEFRFLRDKVATTLRDVTGEHTTDLSFLVAFNSTAITVREIANGKGYQLHLELAGNESVLAPKREYDHYTCRAANVDGGRCTASTIGNYTATAYNGAAVYDARPYDGASDGIVHDSPTPTIRAVIVFFHMSDPANSFEEMLVIPLNLV
ncbi:MAG TPA: hypothetical protein VM681_05850 [Candidatus Thermoplasmatota archaeon]|nr:hypothetical protein [Candidatus Thermoplasmatota archaeon]